MYGKVLKLLINADDAISLEVNRCLKYALKNHVSLVVKDYQPDLIVKIIARQIQSESKEPVIMLSMVVHEPTAYNVSPLYCDSEFICAPA